MRVTTFVTILALTGAAAADPPRVTLTRLPSGGLQPAAAGAEGVLHVVYLSGSASADVYYVRRDAGAESFGAPVRINAQPGAAVALGGVRGPDIALGPGGRVHVAWAGSGKWKAPGSSAAPVAGHAQAPMLYTRLADDGKSFEPERNLMTRSTVLDGGGAVAADGKGKVYVVWHANDKDGGDEADRRVWVAASDDDGKTFAPEAALSGIDSGMCACCAVTAITAPDGPLYLLARTAREGMQRDTTLFTVGGGGGAAATPAPVDAWQIGMCPATTFDIAPGPTGPVLAWETRGQVHWARSDASGAVSKPVAAPVADPKARLNREHPRTAMNGEGVVLFAWVDSGGMGRPGAVAWQIYDAEGKPIEGAAGRQPDLPAWSFPAPLARPDGTFEIVY